MGAMATSTGTAAADDQITVELVDAALGVTRVLVAVAARSLAGLAEDVTLAQFRALVVLGTEGPQRVADLATELAVNASTATRMCDRLVRKSLVTRSRTAADRRTVLIALSDVGLQLVAEVNDRRRVEIAAIAERIPPAGRRQLVDALRAFAQYAGHAPDQQWSLGWAAGGLPRR
jgi:DNA-binding MarR family transcriptional regulator